MMPPAEVKADVPLIAHVIHRLDVGGMENGLVNLINRIAPERYRHAIVCLTEHTDFRSRIERDVEYFSLNKRAGKDLGLYLRLWRVLSRLQPDIVHTRGLAALEAQLPAMLAGVRARVHGEHGRDFPDVDGKSRKYRALRRMFRPLVNRYVPLSHDLADYLRDDIGVAAEKISTIRNGVDTDRFRPAEETAASRLPFAAPGASECLVIGTVGRMEAVKDPMTLARAFVELISRVPGGRKRLRLRLMMVGGGSLRAPVQDYLARAKLSDIVWLPGAREDVPELLRAMHVFVLPSLAEGISNTILEAMASGLPVVATNVGGNAELVTEGETGYLVPREDPLAMADSIRRYADDADLRRRHGANARRRAERQFGIDRMVEQYLDVYDGVLVERENYALRGTQKAK